MYVLDFSCKTASFVFATEGRDEREHYYRLPPQTEGSGDIGCSIGLCGIVCPPFLKQTTVEESISGCIHSSIGQVTEATSVLRDISIFISQGGASVGEPTLDESS